MSDKVIELAAQLISGIQSSNAGFAANLASRIEQSSAKLQTELKSPPKKEVEQVKPGWSGGLLARKRWAWKYRD
jgi:hypothetical protein